MTSDILKKTKNSGRIIRCAVVRPGGEVILMHSVEFLLCCISQTPDLKLSQDIVGPAVILQYTVHNKVSKFLNFPFVRPISRTFDLKIKDGGEVKKKHIPH